MIPEHESPAECATLRAAVHLWQDFPHDTKSGLRLAAAYSEAGNTQQALSTILSLRSFTAGQQDEPRLDLVEAAIAARNGDYARQQALAERAATRLNRRELAFCSHGRCESRQQHSRHKTTLKMPKRRMPKRCRSSKALEIEPEPPLHSQSSPQCWKNKETSSGPKNWLSGQELSLPEWLSGTNRKQGNRKRRNSIWCGACSL